MTCPIYTYTWHCIGYKRAYIGNSNVAQDTLCDISPIYTIIRLYTPRNKTAIEHTFTRCQIYSWQCTYYRGGVRFLVCRGGLHYFQKCGLMCLECECTVIYILIIIYIKQYNNIRVNRLRQSDILLTSHRIRKVQNPLRLPFCMSLDKLCHLVS